MATFRNVPECERIWDEYDEVMLLDLMGEITEQISLNRTLVATGVIAAGRAILNLRRRRLYSEKEVVCRLALLKSRYLEFEAFKATPGIKYDEGSNVVTAGHDYLMSVQFPTVSV